MTRVSWKICIFIFCISEICQKFRVVAGWWNYRYDVVHEQANFWQMSVFSGWIQPDTHMMRYRKTYPEIPESPRWNQQVHRKKYTLSPASVPLIEARPNSQDWKCRQQTCVLEISLLKLFKVELQVRQCNLAPSWFNIPRHPSVYPWYHLWLRRLMLPRTF